MSHTGAWRTVPKYPALAVPKLLSSEAGEGKPLRPRRG